MSRFAKALREEKLLPWQDLMRLCEPRNAAGSRTPPIAHYGWGCMTTETGQAQAIGHGGGAIGMQTWMLIHTRIPLDLMVMTNHHRQADPIKDAVSASRNDRREMTGTYRRWHLSDRRNDRREMTGTYPGTYPSRNDWHLSGVLPATAANTTLALSPASLDLHWKT